VLSPGEYVLTPEATAGIGYGNLDRINQLYSGPAPAPRQYASGGFVSLENQMATASPQAGQIAGADAVRAVHAAIAEAMAAAKKAVEKAAAGSGASIAAFARSFLGKIP
jgi:hypothetical protein